MSQLTILLSLFMILITTFSRVEPISSHVVSYSSLTEGAKWSYNIIRKNEARGSGSYEGASTFIQVTNGEATVKKLDETTFTIEDRRSINISNYGSGIFKQNSTDHISVNTTMTIDRGTQIVTLYDVKNGKTNGSFNIESQAGVPTVHFVSTSLKAGQNTEYYWQGEVITCSIIQQTINFQSVDLSTITLRYSGPKKVPIQTITRFPQDGTAEGTFIFEKTTGLLISYTAKETAMFRSGSCCAVTTSNIENYTLQSTSLWSTRSTPTSTMTQSPPLPRTLPTETVPSQTTVQRESEKTFLALTDYAILIPTLITIAAIIGISYSTVQHKRKNASPNHNATYWNHHC